MRKVINLLLLALVICGVVILNITVTKGWPLYVSAPFSLATGFVAGWASAGISSLVLGD